MGWDYRRLGRTVERWTTTGVLLVAIAVVMLHAGRLLAAAL